MWSEAVRERGSCGKGARKQISKVCRVGEQAGIGAAREVGRR